MPSSIRRSIATPALLLCSLPLAAQNSNKPQLTTLNLQLDWKPTAQFAGVLVAEELGYYKAEGLDVIIHSYDGTGAASVDTVASHAHDAAGWIGVTEADQLLAADARGAQLKAFATELQSTPFALLTLKSSGLTTLKSLRGKTIGLHDDGEKAIDVLVKFNGMTRADVRTKIIGYEFDSLLTGKVDAMQGYTNDEVVRLEMEGHPVNIIPMSTNGYVAYAEVLFGNADYVRTHADVLAKLTRAMGRGWDYARAYPDETAKIIVAKYAPDSSYVEQRASIAESLKLVWTENPHFGAMLPQTWDKSIEMFETYKLVDSKISAADAVDYSILKELYPN